MGVKEMRCHVTPVVYVKISHQDNDGINYHRDDGDLIKRFELFCERNGIQQLRGGMRGPGVVVGYYGKDGDTAESLTKTIDDWLKEQGAWQRIQ